MARRQERGADVLSPVSSQVYRHRRGATLRGPLALVVCVGQCLSCLFGVSFY